MAEKRIIKARDLAASGSNVEKVNIGIRKFHDKVYKHVSLDEKLVAMEDEAPAPDFSDLGEPGVEAGTDEHQVRIERIYGNDGNLDGLKITCRCGEVIELEFAREEDLTLPDDTELETEQFDSTVEPGQDQILVDNGQENMEIEDI